MDPDGSYAKACNILTVRSPIRLRKIRCFQNLENSRIAAEACRDTGTFHVSFIKSQQCIR